MPPGLTRVTVKPFVYFDETAVTVLGLQTTTLHFGRWSDQAFQDEAAREVFAELLKRVPQSRLWVLGVWVFGGQSKPLAEKLFEVAVRKRATELGRHAPSTAVNWSGRPRGNYLLAVDPLPEVSRPDELWFVQASEPDLEAVTREGNEPAKVRLVRAGAIVVDFDQERDLLICELASTNGDEIASWFGPWIAPEGLIR